MSKFSRVALAMLAIVLSACSQDQSEGGAVPSTLNSSSYSSSPPSTNNNNASYRSPTALDITVGTYPANLDVSCDHFNPDAAKKLRPEIIAWMAEIFPSGINRYEHFMIGRTLGFLGQYGQSEHNNFLDAQLGRREAFDQMTALYANQSYLSVGYGTLREHHVAARASGYRGVFLCGGHNCWLAGQCDAYGRRL